MNPIPLRIISIVQARVDAFLKEIFDICDSSEDTQTTKSLSDTVAAEVAICETVEAVIRRRRNERVLFSRLATDIIHSIFGIALDADRIHDPFLPSDRLRDNRNQLFRMRRVSSGWNNFLLSSPRYWQAVDITKSRKAIASVITRSGSAPLCVHSFAGPRTALPTDLVPATRLQTLRTSEVEVYPLYRRWLRDTMPALETLELRAPPRRTNDPIEPLGNFPSIRHLKALWWQPPADTAWLLGLKELVLWRTSPPDAELLRVLSACANLEFLDIFAQDDRVVGERPGSISPITLPRLRAISPDFESNEAVGTLIRGLRIPQCLRRTLCIRKAPRLGPHVADYRSFISMEGSCNWQPPKSASILIKGSYPGSEIKYKTENCKVRLNLPSAEEVPTFHELVQEFQSILKGPCLTVTIKYPSGPTWLLLQSLGNQNIRAIVVDWEHYSDSESSSADLVKTIGTHSADLPHGPITNTGKDQPFESLTRIDIHNTVVNLIDFTRLVEEYLDKNSKPLLKEIVFVDCSFTDMELVQAVKRLVVIGITLRNVTTPEED